MRRSYRAGLSLAAAIVVSLAGSGVSGAQEVATSASNARRDSVLTATTRTVASELRCPVCQGLSINDSPSELAQQMKGLVRDRLASGESPAQVKAYFVQKYGEWILLEPQASGFNLLVYLLPLGAGVGGLLVIVLALRRWTRAGAGGDAPACEVEGEDEANLEEDPALR